MNVRQECPWILEQAAGVFLDRCPEKNCRCRIDNPSKDWPWRVVPPVVREGESGWIYETDPPRFVERQ